MTNGVANVCTPERWCFGMQKNLGDPSAGKGLRALVLLKLSAMTNADPGQMMRVAGVRYCRTSSHRDNGLMLNFCPWCGADLRWWNKDEAPKVSASAMVVSLRALVEQLRVGGCWCEVGTGVRGSTRHTSTCAQVAACMEQPLPPPMMREALLEKGVVAVRDLIAESRGVAGLNLNGDNAPWEDLLAGGEYEGWLRDLSAALEVVPAEVRP